MPLNTTEYESLLVLLRQRREGLGVSQVELAGRLRTTQQYVSKVERGQRRLDVQEFFEWCDGLGVDSRAVYDEFCQVMEGHQGRRQLWGA